MCREFNTYATYYAGKKFTPELLDKEKEKRKDGIVRKNEMTARYIFNAFRGAFGGRITATITVYLDEDKYPVSIHVDYPPFYTEDDYSKNLVIKSIDKELKNIFEDLNFIAK